MTMKFHYQGLAKVISGGQTGVDQGGIFAAHMMGVLTGGTAPKDFKTDRGLNPLLAALGLKADTSSEYAPRTRMNVQSADATLIIVIDITTPGTRCTIRNCKELGKPHFILHLALEQMDANFDDLLHDKANEVAAFIVQHQVRTLNVAGHRDQRHSTEMFQLASTFVTDVMKSLDNDNLLVRDTDL